MKNILLCLLLILCVSAYVQGQTFKVKGYLVGADLTAISDANLELKSRSDSTVITKAVSDKDGVFSLNADPAGAVTLNIKHMSFQPKSLRFAAKCDTTIIITLNYNVNALKPVDVVAAPTIRYDNKGNIIVNMENIPNSDFDNADEALRKMPGVMITNNGISLFGETGVKVQLDGIDINIDPIMFLKSQPASFLAEVELISDATGSHGEGGSVINLISKRKKYNGHTSSVYSTASYNRLTDKLGLEAYYNTMVKRKNFYFTTNSGGESFSYYRTENNSIYYKKSGNTRLRSYLYDARTYYSNINLNFSWDLARKRTLTINSKFHYGMTDRKTQEIESLLKTTQGSIANYKDAPTKFIYSGNFAYVNSKDKPYSIKTSYGIVAQFWNSTHKDKIVYNSGNVTDWTNKWKRTFINQVLKSDYSYKIPKSKFTVYSGVNAGFTLVKEDNDYTIHEGTKYFQNSSFDANELILSLYAEANYKINNKFNVLAGVRGAYTTYDFENRTDNIKADNDFWNVTPWVNFTYNINKNFKSILSYTSGITRPSYSSMLPGMEYYNNYEYWIGNPNLEPAKNQNISLRTIYRNSVFLTIRGGLSKDLLFNTIKDVSDDLTEYSIGNVLSSRYLNTNLSFPVSFIANRFDGRFNFNYSIGKYINPKDGLVIPESRGRFSTINASASLNCSVTKRLSLTGDYTYEIRSKTLYVDTKSYMYADLGATYKFLKKGDLMVTLKATDLFNSAGTRSTRYNLTTIRKTTKPSYNCYIHLAVVFRFTGGKKVDRETPTDPNDTSRF